MVDLHHQIINMSHMARRWPCIIKVLLAWYKVDLHHQSPRIKILLTWQKVVLHYQSITHLTEGGPASSKSQDQSITNITRTKVHPRIKVYILLTSQKMARHHQSSHSAVEYCFDVAWCSMCPAQLAWEGRPDQAQQWARFQCWLILLY